MFYSLQATRGIAALLVVFFHLGVLFNSGKYWEGSPTGHFFEFGRAGVIFFFVLSGFIIAHVHAGDLGNPRRLFSYLFSRFSRIYPIYWLVLIPIAAVYFLVPGYGVGFERNPIVVLSSFTLIRFSGASVLTVAWTLYHEMLFYALFALAIVHKQTGFVLLAVWIAIAAIAPSGFIFSELHILFGIGIAAAWAIRNYRIPVPAFLAVSGGSGFFYGRDR